MLYPVYTSPPGRRGAHLLCCKFPQITWHRSSPSNRTATPAKPGPLGDLVTQPYDKISPADARALPRAQPVQPGARHPRRDASASDSERDNVYTRAAAYLNDWIADGRAGRARNAQPVRLLPGVRGARTPASGWCARASSGWARWRTTPPAWCTATSRRSPARRRTALELLRHTHAHFGQLFMLYPDPAGEIDRLLDAGRRGARPGAVTDEYGAGAPLLAHRGAAPSRRASSALMADKKLLIADGHHRYETALAFRSENPDLAGADKVMMTFVNMHSPGLKILATHRLVSGLAGFDAGRVPAQGGGRVPVDEIDSPDAAARGVGGARPGHGDRRGHRARGCGCSKSRGAAGELDVRVLHQDRARRRARRRRGGRAGGAQPALHARASTRPSRKRAAARRRWPSC